MRAMGLAAVAVQLALAALLGGIATGSGAFPNPPEPVPRGLALGVLYALPAAVGALGALGRRRSLLAAASVLSAIGSILAFSGVTLIFLVPSLLFAAAAGAMASAHTSRWRPSWRALVGVAVGIVTAVLAATRLGVFVLPALVLLLLGLEVMRAARNAPTVGPRLDALLAAVMIVGLGSGAGWTLLTMTETRCWQAYQTPHGIEYRSIPDPGAGPIELRGDGIAGGCDGGSLTVQGASLAAGLGLMAVALAALVARRSNPTEDVIGDLPPPNLPVDV